MNILVGGTQSNQIPAGYYKIVDALVENIKVHKDHLIYGGGSTGLVGKLGVECLNQDEETIAVVPNCYKQNMKGLEAKNLIVTDTVLRRTSKLIKQADLAIFLPGGTGTLQEFFCAIELKRGGEFDHPIVLVNDMGYYNALLNQLDKALTEGFSTYELRNCFDVVNNQEELIQYVAQKR